MTTALDKLYGITNIKSYVPLILDLDRLNNDARRAFFKNHCIAYKVFGHLDGTNHNPDDQDWSQLWKAIKDLFCDNKEANAIELENQLRNITIGESTVMEYYTCIKSISDLLANISSKVPERTLVTYAINGLSSKFDHIPTTIRHKTLFPTLLEMRSMLSIKEKTVQNQLSRIPHASHMDSSSPHHV
ncbi:unnamed protein product [Lactuca saligna]|uniref:Uncharacterized protein n=1 Tax=Lactuca saligna TaxID=75948 RepID=A0AA35ZSF8_LACSI|nr:unnamed protein product [Lactuca saligna]